RRPDMRRDHARDDAPDPRRARQQHDVRRFQRLLRPARPAYRQRCVSSARMHAGLTCAITNPLEAQVRRAILAGDLLLGHDEYAMKWISSYRAELVRSRS